MFLVDASKEMFIKGEDGEASNFDMTMQVCTHTPPEILTALLRSKLMVRDSFTTPISICLVLLVCAQCVHQ